jgi:hypothetical protein
MEQNIIVVLTLKWRRYLRIRTVGRFRQLSPQWEYTVPPGDGLLDPAKRNRLSSYHEDKTLEQFECPSKSSYLCLVALSCFKSSTSSIRVAILRFARA